MKASFAKALYILLILGTASMICIADVKTSSEENKEGAVFDQSRQVRKQLLQSGISSVVESKASGTKTELSRLIAQLQALKLPGTDRETKVSGQPAVEINSKQVKKAVEQSTAPVKPQDKDKKTTTTQENNKNDKDIVSLLEGAENIVNPLAAADCLYVHGEYKTAAGLYQLGLKQLIDTKDNLFRPWALFQAGNCLRYSDPDTAHNYYEQLISGYPESYWTPAARSEQQIIDWFKANKSSVTMEKYISDPNAL